MGGRGRKTVLVLVSSGGLILWSEKSEVRQVQNGVRVRGVPRSSLLQLLELCSRPSTFGEDCHMLLPRRSYWLWGTVRLLFTNLR